MKAAVMLAVLGCALGLPQTAPTTSSTAAAATPAAAAPSSAPSAALSKRQGLFGGGFGGGFGGPQFHSGGQPHHERNWGPKAYGPGLRNPWAFPVNPFVMERAVALTERCPGTLARVGIDGEVMITDQHGFEVEIMDWFGNDITEGIDEFEFDEPTFYMGGAGGFGGASGFGIPPPGFGAAPGAAGMGGSPGAAHGAAGRSSFGQSSCFQVRKFDGFGGFGF